MTIHKIFGDTPPGVLTRYDDGSPSIETATGFYTTEAGTAQCVGGRLWVPAADVATLPSVTLELHGPFATGSAASLATPIRTATVSTGSGGWVEATWSTPVTMEAGQFYYVSAAYPGALVSYLHSPWNPGAGAVQALDGSGLFLAAESVRSRFRMGTGSTDSPNVTAWYGQDIIVNVASNVAPTVNAGVNQTVFVGQPVTLTATGADADGSVTDYVWSKVSGPAATLAGTGASRTFTPGSVGTYTFAVYSVDNEGTNSTPDTMTVTVLAAPVEAPTGGGSVPVAPFPMVEKAVKELIEAKYPLADGKVGGDMSYEPGDGLYVWIGLIPGGKADRLEGEWVLDIDVFGDSYTSAMEAALSLEAALVGPRHVTSVMRLDDCYQNIGPSERPWDDDGVYRIGATYVFTGRRSG